MLLEYEYEIYARENRRGNQEWTIQRNRLHWVHKIQDKTKKTLHNMCQTPRKQTQTM
jgi:hypothetical protein